MAATGVIDCYYALGVARDATIKDINSAYKKLALKHHPDKKTGEDNTRSEFQKIQEAVEILRDPVSRQKHDEQLPPVFYDDGFLFAETSATGWKPHMYTGRAIGNRYVYSFGNSVHMDPYSHESSEERTHRERMRKLDEPVSENYVARQYLWKTHMDVMKERARTEDSLASRTTVEPGENVSDSVKKKEGYLSREYATTDSEEEQGQGYVVPPSGDERQLRTSIHSACIEPILGSQEEYVTADQGGFCSNSSSDFGIEEPELPAGIVSEIDLIGLDSDTSSSSAYYEAKTIPSVIGTSRDATPSQFKLNSDVCQTITNLQLVPLVSYFEAKLGHPSQRYTPDDVLLELEGIILETYCGWLEAFRLSLSGSKPLAARNDPDDCTHLGYWKREFGRPECTVCQCWQPLYLLTCPGCGIQRCVACKFAGWKLG